MVLGVTTSGGKPSGPKGRNQEASSAPKGRNPPPAKKVQQMVEMVEYWKADDGTLWPSESEAKVQEAKKKLEKILREAHPDLEIPHLRLVRILTENTLQVNESIYNTLSMIIYS